MKILKFFLSLLAGYLFITSGKTFTELFAVYTDRHGTWRVPTNGLPTRLTNKMIDKFPRIGMNLKVIDSITFDLDNNQYVGMCKVWILIFGGVGVLYFLGLLIFFLLRYVCHCCGGVDIPKRGYKQSRINCLRFFIILFSFILEFFLIYGYFANTDFHSSLNILVDSFLEVGNNLQNQITKISTKLPEEQDLILSFPYNKTLFSLDLNFSGRAALRRTQTSNNLLNEFEKLRMSLILINLILATFACAIGVASGTVNKGNLMVLMLLLFSISGTLMFFSFGAHFTGSKIIHDYCGEIAPYISQTDIKRNKFIPMRLQYFVPCISSPLFPFLYDHFVVKALSAMEEYMANYKTKTNGIDLHEKFYPQWFNITSPKILDFINANKVLVTEFNQTLDVVSQLTIIDQSMTCHWTKEQIKEDNFLMCVYAKDSLDMLMMCQGCAAIFILILTFLGVPAIKRFQWAGNYGATGILDGSKSEFRGKPPKARRNR